jgi:DNA-binding MarR family transcriptional regulator
VLVNYGFICQSRGGFIGISRATRDLGIPKSTESRILTGMREEGFVQEFFAPEDGRRRIVKLAENYLARTDNDIHRFLDCCAEPGNRLAWR